METFLAILIAVPSALVWGAVIMRFATKIAKDL
jgi:hypothetical protein